MNDFPLSFQLNSNVSKDLYTNQNIINKLLLFYTTSLAQRIYLYDILKNKNNNKFLCYLFDSFKETKGGSNIFCLFVTQNKGAKRTI